MWPAMNQTEVESGSDVDFTLDAAVLAERRAVGARRLHTVQVPTLRATGFVILCAIALAQELRAGVPFPSPQLVALVSLNLVYAAIAWQLLRRGWRADAHVDMSLLLFHVDLLVWLPNLHHLEAANLFFGYFLLVRVVDQVGFGFRRALYFAHAVALVYLLYGLASQVLEPGRVALTDRLAIAAILYLLGLYFAATGLVTERLRNRSRAAIRAARALVERLEQKATALEQQKLELDAARREAEQANRAKSEFLAVTSHEIRTPMNGVLGATELLIGTPLSHEQQRYVRIAHRSATALLRLIDDVLDMSRIEAGKFTLTLSEVDLRALVDEAVELVAVSVRDKALDVSGEVSPRLAERVMADPLRLRQLIVNLLHNAGKFTESGSVRLSVTVLAESGDVQQVRLSVHDTGVGIAPEQLESIFDAFTQVDSSSTRRHGGSGLGLAIVKELATLMQGQVGVESRLGAGSHFFAELPLRRAPGSVPRPPAVQPRDDDDDAQVSVLVVEDDPVNQLVVFGMLKKLGCEVDVVDDGDAAHRAVSAGHYDIVFMDCHMPVMDGFEATRRIRAAEQPGGHALVIVALTADSLASDRQRCLDVGMNDFLTKPVSSSQLSATIERWTGRRTQPATQW
jgi:signal transduction histidine kinase/ActR/RegA family two-component response regulator